MIHRDAVLVLVSVMIATAVAAVLLVGGVSAATPGVQRPPVGIQGRDGPPPQRVDQQQRRVPQFIRPALPLERGVAEAARGATGYLLTLLAVSAALVLARPRVIDAYRASLGDWRVQLRTLATGLAVLLLVTSALFLAAVTFVGALPPPNAGGAFAFQVGLQAGFVVFAVILVLTALPAILGFAATAWRLGDWLLGLRPLARWAAQTPAALVAIAGATLIYVLAQIPYVGIVFGLGTLAHALGSFVNAHLTDRPRASGTP